MRTTAAIDAGRLREKFAAPAGRYLGFVVLVAAVATIIFGVATDARGSLSVTLFALAFSLLSWVVLIRPSAAAHEHGILLTNMLRDVFVPWQIIRACRVSQTLQIVTEQRTYHGLGMTKSARQQRRESRRGRPGADKVPIGPTLFGVGHLISTSSPFRRGGEDDGGAQASAISRVKQEQEGGSYFEYTEQRISVLAHSALASSTPPAKTSPRVSWALLPALALAGAAVCIALAIVL